MREGRDEKRPGTIIRKGDNYYLSWSEFQQSFRLKRLNKDKTFLLPEFVEIEISHVSSAFGQTGRIIEEIKQYEPRQIFQCIVGEVTLVGEDALDYKIGDEVIAFMSSKWVRSRCRAPVKQIVKKPPFLSKEQAAVASGKPAILILNSSQNYFNIF